MNKICKEVPRGGEPEFDKQLKGFPDWCPLKGK